MLESNLSLPILHAMLQEKALSLQQELDIPVADLKVSSVFISQFKERHCIVSKVACGESLFAPARMVDDWKRI